ncbi:MAG: GDSL-type esterase/lipase family protein [Acidobacteria bacterium]|nr:GDSL-type esterase/lipase family protein [Acidobacteriota bacterium]
MRLRSIPLGLILIFTLHAAVSAGLAQDNLRPLAANEAAKLYDEIGDHMEATAMAAPELSRAGAPLRENVRQSAELLQVGSTRENLGVMYTLLQNAKVYVQIAEAIPRANPFSEEIERQLGQLRIALGKVERHFRALMAVTERRLREPDRDNLARYAEANGSLGPPNPEDPRVVFLGDSITDGWPLNQYFPGRPYVNRGIGGQITSQMLGRMKADVIDLKPSVMVVLAGTNDIARGISKEAIEGNLSMIADLAVAHGITPVFASILPISDHHNDTDPNYLRSAARPPGTILELNKWIVEMCRARGFVYLDYFAKTVDANGYLRAELADDGLHPNTQGYGVMTPLVHEAIVQAFSSRKAAPKAKRFGIF